MIRYMSGRLHSKFSYGIHEGEYKYYLKIHIIINYGREQEKGCGCNIAKLYVTGDKVSLAKLLKYIKENCEDVQLIKK